MRGCVFFSVYEYDCGTCEATTVREGRLSRFCMSGGIICCDGIHTYRDMDDDDVPQSSCFSPILHIPFFGVNDSFGLHLSIFDFDDD